MSLSTTTRRNDYVGNGANSIYAYSYRIIANTDLVVTVRDLSDVETTLTLTTDYTVSGVGSASGGNVTLVDASQAWLTSGNLTTNFVITIQRTVAVSQSTDIRNQGSFLPETHEDALDYLTMLAQQQQDGIDGSIRLPTTISPSDFSGTLPTSITDTDNAGRAIVINSSNDGLALSGAILTSVPDYYVQGNAPTDPSTNQLAFWLDTSVDQMKIWARTEWRVIA